MPLANLLLEFWAWHDWRVKYANALSSDMYKNAIQRISQLGKQVSETIVNRQLRGIPAPDMYKGYE